LQRIFLADVYDGKLGYGRDEPPSIATACLTIETDISLWEEQSAFGVYRLKG
jgi:hypothetical protein